jgi:hypothetical protein
MMIRQIVIACLAITVLFGQAAEADTVTAQTILPESREPARDNPDPPCGDPGAITNADKVLQEAGGALKDATGVPVDQIINQLPSEQQARLKVMLGIHNGPSTCATICVTVPADKPVRWLSGFTVILPDGQNIGMLWYPKNGPTPYAETVSTANPADIQIVHTWGRITNMTVANAGSNVRLYCFLGKNHSHTQAREFAIKATW